MIVNLTRETFMMGRDREYPTTEELEVNAARLLHRVRKLLGKYATATGRTGIVVTVTSGYRPGHYNRGYAAASAHLTCQAVDLHDPQSELATWLQAHSTILEDCALYMEDPAKTKGWVHLQSRVTLSGKRIFTP